MIVSFLPVLILCFLSIILSRLLRLDFYQLAFFFSLVFPVGIVILGPVTVLLGFGLVWYFPVLPRSYTLYFLHLFYSYEKQSTAILISEVISLLLSLGFLIAGFGFCRSLGLPTKRFLSGVLGIVVCWFVLTAVLWGSALA